MIKQVLLWLWCFPQMLAGLLVKAFTRAWTHPDIDYHLYLVRRGSITLGEYIFLCPTDWVDDDLLRHERGHRKQSRILGWLYLPVIGLPSIVWAGCFGWYRKKHGVSYYAFYTEKWADKLGGVERNNYNK